MPSRQIAGVPILVVEDDPAVRGLIEHVLAAAKVHSERSLAMGLREAERGGYLVCVLDLNLPDCRGLATLIQFRAHTSIPIVVVATGEPDVAIECVQHGASEVLEKPFRPEELLLRVGMAVAKWRVYQKINTINEAVGDIRATIDEHRRADSTILAPRDTVAVAAPDAK